MRLLFLSNVHPNPLAPTKGTFNGALVRALGAQHDVHVVCPISWVDRLRSRRVSLSSQPVLLQPTVTASYPTFWYPPKILRSQYDHFLEWSIRQRLMRELQAFRPDAVLSYWAHPDGAVAVRVAQQLGIPAVTMVGGSDVLLLGREGRRRQVILRTLTQSGAVIAVSEDIAQQIVADGVPQERVHVVRRGVEPTLFQPGDKIAARQKLGLPVEARILIGVGRLVPVKDWPTLVSTCGVLSSENQPPLCYLLGDGPLRGSLQQQIEQLNLQQRVFVKGSQSQSALADWYRAADLVVLPSLSEGVPNVLLEAIASGTPFVATRVGGIPEIADPDLHRLVAVGQPEAMATAIRESLASPHSTKIPRVQPMSWAASAAQVTNIIHSALRSKRAAPRMDGQRSPTASVSKGEDHVPNADNVNSTGRQDGTGLAATSLNSDGSVIR